MQSGSFSSGSLAFETLEARPGLDGQLGPLQLPNGRADDDPSPGAYGRGFGFRGRQEITAAKGSTLG